MTHTSTEQCTACYGSGTGENGFDCLRCAGDGWVFAEPARPAVAHTSTEQPEALRLAEICESKCLFHVADELRRLHASVQELKEQLANAHQSSGAEAYDIACEEMEAYQLKRAQAGKEVGCTGSLVDGIGWVYDRLEELEASQAQLVPLSLLDAAHLMATIKTHCNYALPPYASHVIHVAIRATEREHGITQEKQG